MATLTEYEEMNHTNLNDEMILEDFKENFFSSIYEEWLDQMNQQDSEDWWNERLWQEVDDYVGRLLDKECSIFAYHRGLDSLMESWRNTWGDFPTENVQRKLVWNAIYEYAQECTSHDLKEWGSSDDE